MGFFLICFFMLFVVSQVYSWVVQFSWPLAGNFPLPICLLAGIGLALISNYDRQSGEWLLIRGSQDTLSVLPTDPNESTAPPPAAPALTPTPLADQPGLNAFPDFVAQQEPWPISFEIEQNPPEQP